MRMCGVRVADVEMPDVQMAEASHKGENTESQADTEADEIEGFPVHFDLKFPNLF